MTRQADILDYVFDGRPAAAPLSKTLLEWMNASPRFTAFVDTYRDKIRKKIRVIREPESALDLRSELEAAYCLLNDRHIDLTYEPYNSAGRRGPDFAVTYRANLVFNIEVAHIRASSAAVPKESDFANVVVDGEAVVRTAARILRVLFSKLGQMQPGMPNLLVIQTHDDLTRRMDLENLMQVLKLEVEKKDSPLYALGRYGSPADFYRDFLRLNGILLWGGSAQLWINKQARPVLEERILRRIQSLISGDPISTP